MSVAPFRIGDIVTPNYTQPGAFETDKVYEVQDCWLASLDDWLVTIVTDFGHKTSYKANRFRLYRRHDDRQRFVLILDANERDLVEKVLNIPHPDTAQQRLGVTDPQFLMWQRVRKLLPTELV